MADNKIHELLKNHSVLSADETAELIRAREEIEHARTIIPAPHAIEILSLYRLEKVSFEVIVNELYDLFRGDPEAWQEPYYELRLADDFLASREINSMQMLRIH